MSKTVAVYGLGSMGYGMAQSVLRAGHVTYGVDVVAERVAQFRAEGGAGGDVSSALAAVDIVVLVVINAAQAEAALFGEDGVAARLKPGTTIVSCITAHPEAARALATRAEGAQLRFLDAPISGGPIKAAEGRLSIMASGAPEAFAGAEPVLDAMAETVFRLGDQVGLGSAMKAVNQLLAGVHIAVVGEAMTFGMTQGIAPEKTLEVISQCAGASWMLENRGPHIVSGDYTPHSSVDIWLKDLGIVLDIARSAKFSAPIAAAALQQYLAASGSGLGGEDDAAVAKVYARNVGLKLPGQAE